MPASLPIRRQAAWLVCALAATAAGCGTTGTVQGGNDALSATTLTVYSNLPLSGPDGAEMRNIVNGEALALYDAGGHAGKFHVSFASLNDAADPVTGTSNTTQTARSAHIAASDLTTVAYIGDFDSAATALALPLSNQNDVLELSPGGTYIGLTDNNPADAIGYPKRNYPNGSRTFARLLPSDLAEAQATVRYMHALGVKRLYLLGDSANSERAPADSATVAHPPYDAAIAQLVAGAAPGSAITLVGRDTAIDTQRPNPQPADYARIATAVAAQHPDAVLLGGVANAGAQALWKALHTALPRAKLFAPSILATASFLHGLGAATSATYVTSPILEARQYPAKAQQVFADYRRAFPGLAPTPYALYGYEAMSDVLRAITRAGRLAAQREKLVQAFFNLGVIHGVIGDYTINAHGDTSLASFDGYRATAGGQLVLVRPIS